MSLYIDKENKMIAGVIAGFAKFFKLNVTVLRIAYVLIIIALIAGVISAPISGFLIFTYLLCWVLMPKVKTDEDKMKMETGLTGKIVDQVKEFKGDLDIIQIKCKSCGFVNNVKKGEKSKICTACDAALIE